jgi:hypothetical protein
MPSPLRNMPPLAAAATECRLIGVPEVRFETSPSKNCSVRLHGELIVNYRLRRVGGPKVPAILHDEPPRKFEQSFELYDPDTFFLSYTACRDSLLQMLTLTPLLREFDLGADNWDIFTPGIIAMIIVDWFRRGTDQHGGVAVGIDLNLRWVMKVRIIYSEPKALLLACVQAGAVAPCQSSMALPPAAECCSICMEDLAARVGAVRLPCSHCFHRGCILPWFYKVATCPICRRHMGKYLVAATNTPMGMFPGLR